MIEAVIAAALLATATYGLTTLAKSAADLSQQSDQRLAATLAAENTLERLRRVPIETLIDQVQDVGKMVAASSHCEVDVSALPFETNGRQGIHLRVDVSPSKKIRVTLHDWRLPTKSSKEASPEELIVGAEPVPTESTPDALPREVKDD